MSKENNRCYGMPGQLGVITKNNPQSTDYLCTGGLGDCVAFAFVIRNIETNAVQKIALIHSISEHKGFSAQRYRDALKEKESFGTASAFRSELCNRNQLESFARMMVESLSDVGQDSRIEIHFVQSIKTDCHDEHNMQEPKAIQDVMYDCGYRNTSLVSYHTPYAFCAMSGKGKLYISEKKLTRDMQIEQLICKLQNEKNSPLLFLSAFSKDKSLKIEFLTRLKNSPNENPDIHQICSQLAKENNTTSTKVIDAVCSGVFSQRTRDLLIQNHLLPTDTALRL